MKLFRNILNPQSLCIKVSNRIKNFQNLSRNDLEADHKSLISKIFKACLTILGIMNQSLKMSSLFGSCKIRKHWRD